MLLLCVKDMYLNNGERIFTTGKIYSGKYERYDLGLSDEESSHFFGIAEEYPFLHDLLNSYVIRGINDQNKMWMIHIFLNQTKLDRSFPFKNEHFVQISNSEGLIK